MKALPSYFLFGLLWIISLLPFRALYLLSDLLYPLVYYIFRYRRDVVRGNLTRSFPEKTSEEIIQIEKKFYRHFCDVTVESIKIITYPAKGLLKRVEIVGAEKLQPYYHQGRHGIMATGHYANWEWLVVFPFITDYHTMAVYKPLHDKVMDKLIMHSRRKGMDVLVPMHKTLRAITGFQRDNIPTLSLFIADQTPVKEETEYFTWFLNQETAAFEGIEKIARKFDEVVYFFRMDKIKRGKYRLEIIEICSNPKDQPKHAITDKYFEILEECIRNKPELWLWSHRRWKFDSRVIHNRDVDLSPKIPRQYNKQ